MVQDKLTKFTDERILYNKESQKVANRERLKQFLKKKMTTIMVGAIDEFEKSFGEVWGHKFTSDEKNDDELDMTAIWNMCRNEVFDRGNAQIRAMFNEIDTYEIELIRHTVRFNTNKDSTKR